MDNFNKHREKALNSILDILRCPETGTALSFDNTAHKLTSEAGYEYEIINYIPVLIKSQTHQKSFDYLEHYKLDAELFDYHEQRTGGTLHDERRVFEYILNYIKREAISVLDVGCGNARLAGEMLQRGNRVCSLDISLTNTSKAMELYPSDRHSAVIADALSLPFADSSFDCIVCSEVIEHTVDPDKIVEELVRCVKPNGQVILTTPYKEKLKYYLCIHCNKQTPVNAHLHSFDENKLLELFSKYKNGKTVWKSFGNKALLHLRTHVVLKYLPFSIWKIIDSLFNLLINKQAHIIVTYTKENG